jgi:DnaJ-class molecular chaperone
MKIKQAIQILKDHNEWRRFNSIDLPKTSDPKMAHPRELDIAIDTVVKHFETQNIVNNCEGCGIETEDKAKHCEVCECKGNEAYKE